MSKKIPPYWILMAPGLLVLFFFFLFPLGQIVLFSFFKSQPGAGMEAAFTLENYFRFLSDPHYLGILWRTIWIGLATSIICLIMGYSIAYGISRSNPKYQNLLLLLVILPLLTSAVVRNFGWMVIMGKNGLINQALLGIGLISEPAEILYTSTGVVIAMTHVMLPFMVLILYPVLDGLDLNVESAAESLGASPGKVFWLVTIPLSIPGILAGTLLVFSMSISFYITPALIGGPRVQVMATEVYNQTMNLLNWPFSSAVSVILLITVLIIISFYNKAMKKVSPQGAE
ncbi:ABC transporter permease [Siminovitchia terrae]|uniref:ABC transporter permease n=1 Tax=Siminovitchia terrae TaxID=1914933 RepID=A0A429XAG0_SIMTE|nr:ABC transporter permease [Siminovitchia terrae]RST60341.1 ABC transporter permease [Siminovitchia terrae]GIN90425.1 ABC transporter permease [Siminovitchia terrae]GIN97033.1 ABC transporter permease [Siminovitchia terrae]